MRKVKNLNLRQNSRAKKFILRRMLRRNREVMNRQSLLLVRIELLSEKQQRYERLNRLTRILALSFIAFRITIYVTNLLN